MSESKTVRSRALLVTLAVLSAVAVAAQPADEQGIERTIAGFFAAHNSGDADRMLAFYADHATESFRGRRSEQADRALYERLRRDLGDLSLETVDFVGEGRVLAGARSSVKPIPVVFDFRLEGVKIDGFGVEIGGPGRVRDDLPDIAFDGGGTKQRRAALDRWLQDLAAGDRFSGVVLVARDGRVVYQAAAGLANRERALPVRPDTGFDVGSITKSLTKMAIGQLARDGRLSLDATLAEMLPDYPNPQVAKRITVRQLVEHRSGLGDIFNDRWDRTPKDALRTPRDFFAIFADEPLRFEPGTERRYSNAGYIVLGAVIEAASGQSYDAYLNEKIFKPAGMTQSGLIERDGKRDDVAVGYTRRGSGRLEPNFGMLPVRGCPAGSSTHTARDLLRFENALKDGTLLGPAWTDWFFTGRVPEADEASLSGGIRYPGLGIAGGGPGVSAALESDPSTTVIVLSNLDEPGAEQVARRLRQVFRD